MFAKGPPVNGGNGLREKLPDNLGRFSELNTRQFRQPLQPVWDIPGEFAYTRVNLD